MTRRLFALLVWLMPVSVTTQIPCKFDLSVYDTGCMYASGQAASPTQSLAWEHPNVVAQRVERFEVSFDSGAFVDVGLVPLPGVSDAYYTMLTALITGLHNVVIRACNGPLVMDCSVASAPPFVFDVWAGPPDPIDGATVRIVDTPGS